MRTETLGKAELRAASAPILSELTRLAASTPPKIAAMVIYIRDHLFDPALSVARVKSECGLRDNSIALYFHRELGLPPGIFITAQRLAVAERLLGETLLPIWKITELLGYSSIQVFSRVIFRHKGMRPSDLRRLRASAGEDSEVLVAPEGLPASEPDFLRRALDGQLEDREAFELVQRLLEIYPLRRSPRRPKSVAARC